MFLITGVSPLKKMKSKFKEIQERLLLINQMLEELEVRRQQQELTQQYLARKNRES